MNEGLIARTLRIIASHPNTAGLEASRAEPETGAWEVDVDLRLGLPNAWMEDGRSPNGVRAVERVTLLFPRTFPLRAPSIRLRADFDRSLAHVQPGSPSERPEPCIVDGSLAELLQQQGLAGILNQLILWLENAALGRLIDREQGWEPVRRDALSDIVVADAESLRSLVSRTEGYAVFGLEYVAVGSGDARAIHGEILKSCLVLNPNTIGGLFDERSSKKVGDFAFGHSVALVVWPGRRPSGQLIIADRYQPETVTDLASLNGRAADYGCATPLDAAFRRLETCLKGYEATASFPIVVMLCARRPFHLIGSASNIELCPYIVEISAPSLLPKGEHSQVMPAGHRHAISTALLQQLAGASGQVTWVQLGCGSLGSKIALHLARAGRAPARVIDRGYLSPHNAARHALTPPPGRLQIPWVGSKANAVAQAIEGLGQEAEAICADIITLTRNAAETRRILSRRTWGLVNSTASLAVREALGSVAAPIEIPRVIETVLFGNGRLGILTVEGPGRNPDTLDLMAEAYAIARADDGLRNVMFSAEPGLTRQPIGEGCGSATMVMSDARLSMFAAAMGEGIAAMQNTALPSCGRVLMGALGADGLSLNWNDHAAIAPVVVVAAEGSGGWRVRISARAAAKIEEEVRRWPTVETGGILMGRISEAARAFYVTDVLAAPDDSLRSAAEFVLGVQGARGAIAAYADATGFSLFCLGTWHSHLVPSGPSGLDRSTAASVALARLAPSILLIHTPVGYRALLAETVHITQ